MKLIYTVLFAKMYYLCSKYMDKEFPQYFASGVLSIFSVMLLSLLIDTFFLIYKPTIISSYNIYYKYLSVGVLGLNWFLFGILGYYKKVLDKYQLLTNRQQKVLGLISLFFVMSVVVLSQIITFEIRDYNLSKQ